MTDKTRGHASVARARNPAGRALAFALPATLAVLLALLELASAACPGKTELRGASGQFSDGFAGFYPVNVECMWLLVAPSDDQVITLTIQTVDTEEAWDFVFVYDGATITSSPQLGAFSGSRSQLVLVSSGPSMLVVFRSDDAVVATGFTASFISAPCPLNCSGAGVCMPQLERSCVCSSGRWGEFCERAVGCPVSATGEVCSGAGSCDSESGLCSCNPGFAYRECATAVTPGMFLPLTVETELGAPIRVLSHASTARVGAVLVSMDESVAVLFGGHSFDLRAYDSSLVRINVSSGAISQVTRLPGSLEPPGVVSAAAISYDGTLVVVGGETADKRYSAAVWQFVFDRESSYTAGSWTLRTVSGLGPSARAGHAGVFVPNPPRLVVYGGVTATGAYSGELFALDLTTWRWESLAQTGTALPLSPAGHSLVYLPTRNALVLFGGNVKQIATDEVVHVTSQLWMYSLSTARWEQVSATANWPPARFMHVAVATNTTMLVFGGSALTESPAQRRDVWALDLLCGAWRQITPALGLRASSAAAGALVGASPAAQFAGAKISVLLVGGFNGAALPDVWEFTLDACIETPGLKPNSCPYAPAVCAPSCPTGTSCAACTLRPSCWFCAGANACVLGADVAPVNASCVASSNSELVLVPWSASSCAGALCASATSCSTCMAIPECGWCALAAACVSTESTCSSDERPLTTAAECPIPRVCSNIPRCAECAASGCNWCSSWLRCADPGLCPPGSAVVNVQSQCPATCESASFGTCSSCLTRGLGCLYCANTGACFDADNYLAAYPFGECTRYTSRSSECAVSCEAHTSCGTCVANLNCGWCATTSRCMSGLPDGATVAGACAAGDWDFWTCPCDGAQDLSCAACVAEPACGWCATTGLCSRLVSGTGLPEPRDQVCTGAVDRGTCFNCTAVAGFDAHTALSSNCAACTQVAQCGFCWGGSRSAPAPRAPSCVRAAPSVPPVECVSGFESRTCVDCSRLTSCSSCTAQSSCGWCDGRCVAASAAGPVVGSGVTCAVFSFGNCDAYCAARATNCTSCRSDPSCGWCCASGATRCRDPRTCVAPALVQTTCPSCSTRTSCASCAASSCCGWCSSPLGCLSATNNGPSATGACALTLWSASAATCPVDCSALVTCTSCTGSSSCGWCESSASCTARTLAGTCASGLFIGSCPLDCALASSCSTCLSLGTRCAWCETTARCTSTYGPAPPPCAALFPVQCPVDCSVANSCGSCAGLTGCGWCADSSVCIRGTATAPTYGACPNWFVGGCSGLCELFSLRGCTSCLGVRGCGYCPLASVPESRCVAGHTTAPLTTICVDYAGLTCPPTVTLALGNTTRRILSPADRTPLAFRPLSARSMLTLTTTVNEGSAFLFVDTATLYPGVGRNRWSVSVPGKLEIGDPDSGATIEVTDYYAMFACSSVRCDVTLRIDATGNSDDAAALRRFWIVYFVGVFLGSLLGLLVVGLLIRRVRASLNNPPPAAQLAAGAALAASAARSPAAAIHTVALACVAQRGDGQFDAVEPQPGACSLYVSERPYFLVQPAGASDPQVFVVIEMPVSLPDGPADRLPLAHLCFGVVVDELDTRVEPRRVVLRSRGAAARGARRVEPESTAATAAAGAAARLDAPARVTAHEPTGEPSVAAAADSLADGWVEPHDDLTDDSAVELAAINPFTQTPPRELSAAAGSPAILDDRPVARQRGRSRSHSHSRSHSRSSRSASRSRLPDQMRPSASTRFDVALSDCDDERDSWDAERSRGGA